MIKSLIFLALIVNAHAAGPMTSQNTEKMCVCDVCGGRLVPCRDTKEAYIKSEDKSVVESQHKVQSAQDSKVENK